MKYILLASLLLLAHFDVSVSAQESDDRVSSADEVERTHDAIRDMRDGLLKAIDGKDVDSVLSYLHEDVVFIAQAGEELKLSRGHNAVRDYLDQLLTGENAGVQSLNLNVEVKELTTLYGDDTGVSFGTSDDHYVLRDGTEFDLATVWSATLVKEEASWKVASLQLSINPFDNPVLDALKGLLYLVGAVGSVIGILIGFVTARLLTSRAS